VGKITYDLADFIPNDIKNPARKIRVQKAAEFGAFCINEWNDRCMYMMDNLMNNNLSCSSIYILKGMGWANTEGT